MSSVRFDKISSWNPRWRLERHDSGFKLTGTVWHGVVEVFSHDGSTHTATFTSIEYRTNRRIYATRLRRCYHRRWLGRIAMDFVQLIDSAVREGATP